MKLTALPRTIVFLFCASFGIPETARCLTVDEIARDRSLWPKVVRVEAAFDAPVIISGKVSGKANVPAGLEHPVLGVTALRVRVSAMGGPVEVEVGTTDLIRRADEIKGRRDVAAQTATTPAVSGTKAAAVAQAKPSVPQPTPTPATQAERNVFAEKIAGELVKYEGREFKPFRDAAFVSKPYTAIYYSAAWCGPCRAFTPDLVSFYKRKKSKRDQFEIVFISNDKSEDEMKGYMKEDKMDWPAVPYARLKTRHPVHEFEVKGIPCLLIVDQNGKLLPELYEDGNYIGARAALDLLQKRIAK